MVIHPVILSGGAGSRLWPLSREYFPKPLLPLVSEKTLLQDTVLRLSSYADVADPIFVCNEEHRFLVGEQVRQLGIEPKQIMLEPIGRNTAPALTIAALQLEKAGQSNDVMVVMPADHVIPDVAKFTKAVLTGAELTLAGNVVTFGIVPSCPETGYGYIKKGKTISDNAFQVKKFVEKPNQTKAQAYVDSGDYYWNSGIFVITPAIWLKEIKQHRLDIYDACVKAIENGSEDGDFYRVEKSAFEACPSDSIDYAVMENTQHAAVVPLDTNWSDVGAFSSIWDVSDKDENGNVTSGDVLIHNVKNSLLLSESRVLSAVGVENIVVVETADAVLVVPKDQSQDVKQIVNQLKQNERSEHKLHRKVYRPWGTYEGVDAGLRFQVKRLTVKPGAELSLQMHHHRAEHWVVVHGTAEVTKGEEVFTLAENESTYIPQGVTHRLRNPGEMELEIIEVQSGSYLGEDDIVRFEDVYNRC